MKPIRKTILVTILLAVLIPTGYAKELAAPQPLSLPWVVTDAQGVRWDVQADGAIGDGGNDIYDGGGRLFLDNRRPYSSNGQGVLDRERQELMLSELSYKGLFISRRVAVNKELGFCRWAEVLRNPTSVKVTLQLRINFDLGGSIQAAQPYADPKTGKALGMAVGDQRHALAVVAGGRGGKLTPNVQTQQGGDQINLIYDVEVPPRETVVVVHVQGYRKSVPSATQFIAETRERLYVAQLPADLQKRVVNFRPTADKSIEGDYELLRGETTDLIELRAGAAVGAEGAERERDLLRGTLRDSVFHLTTGYGEFDFDAQDVACILNPRSALPRQLLVTKFGEVYFGQLKERAIAFELSDGRNVSVPVEAVSRVGARPRAGEPEEWKLDRPMAVLRSGDRVNIYLPPEPLRVNTRYGVLALRPETVAAVVFRPKDGAAHQVQLTDGSTLTGLVEGEAFDLQLASASVRETIHLPASSFSRLQFVPSPSGAEDHEPVLRAANGDVFVGALEGEVHLDAAYDTLRIDLGEVRRMAYVAGSLSDVEMTLWDGSLVRGQLREGQVVCRTMAGVAVTIPVPLVGGYDQPRPAASGATRERIAGLVGELDSANWRQRGVAQAKLIAMGPIAIRTLSELYPRQSVEVQQRIELVLPVLEEAGKRAEGAGR